MKQNKIGKTLRIIGVSIIILGIIASLIMAMRLPIITTYGLDAHVVQEIYNWPLAISGSIVSFVSGVLFIGFSEIINLLHNIENTLR